MCLILTWKCKKTFQASWVIFSRMKEAVGFIATASSGIWYECCYTIYRIKFYWPCCFQVKYFHAPREHEHLPKPPLMWVEGVVSQEPCVSETLRKRNTGEMREGLIGKQIESCTLGAWQARSEEHLKHPDRWLQFEQLLFVPKHVTLSEKMRFAWLVSIPLGLLTSSEVLSCAHWADVSLDMLEKCQLLPVRIPSLFEQNVLKAVGRTQIEGRCKVYAGRTNWKTSWKLYPWSLQARSEEHLKKAILVDFRTEIGRPQNSHFLFLSFARRPHTTQSDLHLSSWTFLELLARVAV